MNPQPCPQCQSLAAFSPKREKYYCAECEDTFEPLIQKIDPQTIFLSYAHKSEREEDYDVSEELVLLVKEALEKDGHTVWIDKEGIQGGHNWRENITRAILSHDHFLSFLSKRSVRDPGVCLNEIAIARDKGVNFQTVLTEPEDIVKPPITVTDTQWHQFVGWKDVHSGDKTAWDTWFEERMKGIRAQIEDVKNARAPGELTILRRALDPTTFYQDIAKKTEGFFGRKWLFDAFDHWLDKTNDRVFWLKGSPGIGKSAFAAKLVHQSNSRIIGFFKCDFQALKSPEESAREVICTLAYQLASRMPDYRAKLLYGQGVNDPEVILKKTADDLFRFLITEPLNKQGKIVEGQRSAIVIDALDEAGRNDGTNPLLTLIKKHAPNLPDWLGIVITSRPEGYIVQELADIKAQSVSGDTQENTDDLKEYLNQELDPKIVGDERSKIISQIITKSDGTFLYISQIIKDKYDLTKPELLPDGMNGYFMENFSRYFKDAKEYGKETEPFLELMVAAPGPLPQDLGKDLLEWTDRDVTLQVTEPMGSLLQEKDGGLIFFHKSLSDWLQDPKRSGRYQVNLGGAKKLGHFLWNEFEKNQPKEEVAENEENNENKEEQLSIEKPKRVESPWEKQIIDWLPKLLPSIEQWQQRDSLDAYADFLNEYLKYQYELMIRQQHLKLTEIQFGTDAADTAKSLNDLGNLLETLGRYDEAEPLLRRALAIREKVLGPEHPDTAKSLDNLGYLLGTLGRYHEAELLHNRALAISEKVFGPEHPDTASFLNNLGNLLTNLGRYEEAEPLYKRSQAINEKVLGPEHPSTGANVNNLGLLLTKLGRYEEAEPLLKRALLLTEKVLGSDHPDTTICFKNLGNLLTNLGRYEEAEPLLKRALLLTEKVLGSDHPDTASYLNSLGYLLTNLGRNNEAEPLFRRALAISEKVLGPDHPDTANYLNSLGYLLTNLGRNNEAESLFRKALAIREKVFGPKNSSVGNTLFGLAKCLIEQNRIDEYKESYLREIEMVKKIERIESTSLMTTFSTFGASLRNAIRLDEVAPSLEKALDLAEKCQVTTGNEINTDLYALGRVRLLHARYQESEVLFLRCLEIGDFIGNQEVKDMIKERLVELYQAWGRPEEADKHKDKEA
ncbi:toll/interleukin-1 receptor domain-containing protein [Polynucleobacter rarus]|uniref:toll/interleukin-1 receptor domain-containing protein n=1 Tax=Polynucleobacter rarus TaxID=556055 RepID=UPI000D3EC430|nr:toll/interleukin-1 receptor domain-containing protein [Polynucleobacter rarus]